MSQQEPETEQSEVVDVDEIIKNRLLVLKEDRLVNRITRSVTDEDIAIRIANLKGVTYSNSAKKDSTILMTDKRTDEQKIKDILHQFMDESSLDRAADPCLDIERRLAKLKGNDEPSSSVPGTIENVAKSDDEDETEDETIKKLVKKYLAEATLPSEAGSDPTLTAEEKEFIDSIDVTKEQKELPWCVICNEDATLRYQGDLFCKDCYKEVKEEDDSQ